MKLNKTEQLLLNRIDADPHKTTAILWGYRTRRKNGSFGNREFNAAISLRDKGLIEIVKSLKFQDSNRYFTDNWHETLIRRKAA